MEKTKQYIFNNKEEYLSSLASNQLVVTHVRKKNVDSQNRNAWICYKISTW